MHRNPSSKVAGASCLLPLLAFAAGCAEGGSEDRPQSEVRITASHHMFGFRGLGGFGSFPIKPEVVFTDRGRLNLFDDSAYTITRVSGTSGAQRYAIESDGYFSVFVTGSGSEPSVVFRGGYGLIAANADYCFTDRVSTPASPSLGLYYGTRVVEGQVELEGGWHVLSLHAVFGQAILSPENVGRGAFGGVSITAGAPGEQRTISGTGTQGTSNVVFGGSIQNLLTAGSGDGTCNLTVSYQVGGGAVDSRVMLAAASSNMVFGLDSDETDGEAGILLMVRKFDVPAAPVDSVRVPGEFYVGGQTIFVNPSNAGSDAFIGVVKLSSPPSGGVDGGFRLDATGSQGTDFSYAGTWHLELDGRITISISGTNETWHAAIDRTYQTLTFVDDFIENRSNNTPELNLGICVRKKKKTN
jgi:hypothetical protein